MKKKKEKKRNATEILTRSAMRASRVKISDKKVLEKQEIVLQKV